MAGKCVLDMIARHGSTWPYALMACYVIRDAYIAKDREFFLTSDVVLWADTANISVERLKYVAGRCLNEARSS